MRRGSAPEATWTQPALPGTEPTCTTARLVVHVDATGTVAFGLDVFETTTGDPLMIHVPPVRSLRERRRVAHEYLDALLDQQDRLTAPF